MNLWPDEFGTVEKLPYQVLFQQSELFNWHNINLSASSDGDPLENKCTLVVIRKGREAEILQIHHADGYPCKVWFDGKVSKVRTEAELIGKLAWAFNHAKTKQVIADLLK